MEHNIILFMFNVSSITTLYVQSVFKCFAFKNNHLKYSDKVLFICGYSEKNRNGIWVKGFE